MSDQRTEMQEIGEFGLIRRLAAGIVLQQPSTLKGIGDDAAVIDLSPTEALVVTSDMLLEGIHFDLAFMPLQHLGYKAVAVNVSDIAAMNAIPTQITVGIAFSNRFSVEAIELLYTGIKAACEAYKVDLVGGDTTSSHSGLVISITALGRKNKAGLVYRNGAKPTDILCVTGDLGAAYAGLQVLEREKEIFRSNPEMQPDLERYEYLVGRQLRPEARMDVVYELEELQVIPTSMIDISDGLASELLHLCNASGTGARVFEDKLPIDQQTYETAVELGLDPVTCAMNGGEDYELLFTIKVADFEKVKQHQEIHVIGFMHEYPKQIELITKNENVVPIRAQGWDHFKS